jgi:uncharacterized repeat protein (TIGR03803 family)
VFNVTSSGKEKVIYSFVGPPDGSGPTGNLVRDALGNLYGTTLGGGNSSRYGTVFELSATGTEKLLYVFRGGSDGSYPYAGLLRDAKTGNLYGTTNSGGAHGAGTVFEVTPAGVETILYAFAGNPDGARPIGGLIRDAKGNFYGTTQVGGNFHGTVFELTRAGTEKVLYAFTTGGVDGEYPQGGLVLDTKTGNLYGTTLSGGVYGHGTVFEVTPAGVETVLYSFTGGVDGGGPGGYPQGSLVRDAATGSLYGTTEVGGTYGYGTVFKVTP